jgi:hypothetical protein
MLLLNEVLFKVHVTRTPANRVRILKLWGRTYTYRAVQCVTDSNRPAVKIGDHAADHAALSWTDICLTNLRRRGTSDFRASNRRSIDR